MAILYWSVVIIGVILIPIIAGVMYGLDGGYDDELGDYVFGTVVAIICMFFWPAILPIALTIGFFAALFAIPAMIAESKTRAK